MGEKNGIGRLEFWLGLIGVIVSIVIAVAATSWTVSNRITDEMSQERQEINGSIQTSEDHLNGRIDKLDSKVDTGFKDTTSQLNDIKVMIATSTNHSGNKNQ
ncbi:MULTISPECIES: hypothetical protein [unclassified Serratia (in: enterobacteria)]|uniref:hypothetical protein n=1 Tax=unclassified Serratia (in: enterobacteria) TaxID=2647522 RepID=UPI003B43BB03